MQSWVHRELAGCCILTILQNVINTLSLQNTINCFNSDNLLSFPALFQYYSLSQQRLLAFQCRSHRTNRGKISTAQSAALRKNALLRNK